jgi:hypothetical protein
VVEAIDAMVFVEMEDALGIGVGPEPMPPADQSLPKGKIIVDLPVENDMDCIVFVGDRLSTSLHADDAQTAHPDPDAASDQTSLVVRPSMTNGIAHQGDVDILNRRPVEREYPGDSAHGLFYDFIGKFNDLTE